MEDGPVLRKGKKGAFVCPQMAPFETMDAGQMEKKARLLAERPADWITVKYVDEPYRVRVETAHAKICFAKDGSMESFYDRDLDREWTDGAFHKLHIYQDLPGVYDAWDILPNYKEKELEITVKKPLHLVVADGACALFEVVLGTEASSWKMQIRLFADSNEIEVEHLVDWCAIPAPDLYAGRPIRILPGSRQDLRCVCINGAIWQSRTAELRS